MEKIEDIQATEAAQDEVGGWVYQDAADLAGDVASKSSDLYNIIQEEDPASAIKLCDEIASKLSELRSELSEHTIADVSDSD